MINRYSILNVANYFYSGILQNVLVFTSAKEYFRFFTLTIQIHSWKTKGMSEESIKNITVSNNCFAPTLINYYSLPNAKFNEHCLVNNISIPLKVINIYISYIPDTSTKDLNTDFTLNSCLFGSVLLTKNADLDKYKYSCLWHRI